MIADTLFYLMGGASLEFDAVEVSNFSLDLGGFDNFIDASMDNLVIINNSKFINIVVWRRFLKIDYESTLLVNNSIFQNMSTFYSEPLFLMKRDSLIIFENSLFSDIFMNKKYYSDQKAFIDCSGELQFFNLSFTRIELNLNSLISMSSGDLSAITIFNLSYCFFSSLTSQKSNEPVALFIQFPTSLTVHAYIDQVYIFNSSMKSKYASLKFIDYDFYSMY